MGHIERPNTRMLHGPEHSNIFTVTKDKSALN